MLTISGEKPEERQEQEKDTSLPLFRTALRVIPPRRPAAAAYRPRQDRGELQKRRAERDVAEVARRAATAEEDRGEGAVAAPGAGPATTRGAPPPINLARDKGARASVPYAGVTPALRDRSGRPPVTRPWRPPRLAASARPYRPSGRRSDSPSRLPRAGRETHPAAGCGPSRGCRRHGARKASGKRPTVGPTMVTRASGRAHASRSSSVSLSRVVPVISSTSACGTISRAVSAGRKNGISSAFSVAGSFSSTRIRQTAPFQLLQERNEGSDDDGAVARRGSHWHRTHRRPARNSTSGCGRRSPQRSARAFSVAIPTARRMPWSESASCSRSRAGRPRILPGNGIAIADDGQQTASGMVLIGVAHAPVLPVLELDAGKEQPDDRALDRDVRRARPRENP